MTNIENKLEYLFQATHNFLESTNIIKKYVRSDDEN